VSPPNAAAAGPTDRPAGRVETSRVSAGRPAASSLQREDTPTAPILFFFSSEDTTASPTVPIWSGLFGEATNQRDCKTLWVEFKDSVPCKRFRLSSCSLFVY
jgi:hypothetical protein